MPNFLAFNPAHALVKDVLSNPQRHEWTLQGFGMLRTYMQDDVRLHVWDSRFGTGASPIHTHPWDFVSYVVVGTVVNRRYGEVSINPHEQRNNVLPYMRRTIKPGVGLEVLGADVPVLLEPHETEVFKERTWYFQYADEIHESSPHDGSVTLVRRRRGDRSDVARTYYPLGKNWVSGEPRKATPSEVTAICQHSLERWFNDVN